MRKALLGGALLAAFTFASPAGAGCWATVGLAPPPNGLAAGKTWTAELKSSSTVGTRCPMQRMRSQP